MILHRLTLHPLVRQALRAVTAPRQAAVSPPLLTQALAVVVIHPIRHQVLPSHLEVEVGAEADERDLLVDGHTLLLHHLHLRPQEVDPERQVKGKVVENMIPGHHRDPTVGVAQDHVMRVKRKIEREVVTSRIKS